ncbi:STAS domain-containing protein [Paludisphaera rhizosphaerae]|uniref:STAS domain-containing protein n=1 Tax=Paludisphaera rhizosphaerae TaxID=2711216 RepID=UPI0013EDC31B|nr:STAS domain-containing protein [Paludisphaera rhizosphaerae]
MTTTTQCPACSEPSSIDDPQAPCTRCGRGVWFSWSRQDGQTVLRPKKDLLNSHPLDQFLESVEFEPGDHLVIDLSDVHYIASEALGRLMGLRKRLIAAQGRLTLRGLHPDLAEVFRVTRIESFFDIEP